MLIARFLALRLAVAVPIVLGIVLVTFMLIRIGHQDPVAMLAGPLADASTYQMIRRELDLDRPVLRQFMTYVDRVLHEGDEAAGFTVLEVPGHSPGHVAFWRERDGVLILGDVINNLNILTGVPGLHEPPLFVAADPAENRRSARRLAGLEPRVMLFGHGAPLRDTQKFVDFVAGLPDP